MARRSSLGVSSRGVALAQEDVTVSSQGEADDIQVPGDDMPTQ